MIWLQFGYLVILNRNAYQMLVSFILECISQCPLAERDPTHFFFSNLKMI